MDAAWVAGRGRFATERIGVIQMPVERSIDIDSASDLERAEHLLAARMGPMINSIGQTTR
jgi:CMP-N-acetylneuraminic acid synthetase